MTIDRGYLEICKALAPGAFTRNLPFTPQVCFIDAQLRLLPPDFIRDFSSYMRVQFVNPVNRLFEMGASTVVFSFDCYPLVPLAKAPTQRKRTTKIPSVSWDHKQDIPAMMPPNFPQLLMNRVFKSKICAWVVSQLPSLVELGNGRSLVIDYDDFPLTFTAGDVPPTPQSGYKRTGESDTKFVQHLQPGQPFLADSVDGDYVVIAMAQIAKAIAANETPPRILVRRIEIKPAAAKRKRDGDATDKRRQYEIVDVNAVVTALIREIHNKVPKAKKGLEIPIFTYLVALTGCDFCAGIPRVGPNTVWKSLGKIWGPLQDAYDPILEEFNVRKVADKVVAPLLHGVYKKHASTVSGLDITRLLNAIKVSKTLSEKARSELATIAEIACIVRNSNWTLHYWNDATTAPLSAQSKYGFAVKKNGDVERDTQAVLGVIEMEALQAVQVQQDEQVQQAIKKFISSGFRRIDDLKALVEAGADMRTFIWKCLNQVDGAGTLTMLFLAGVDFNVKLGPMNTPPLSLMVARGDVPMARRLLDEKSVNATDDAGFTALHHAVLTGNERMLDLILEQDAVDVTAKTTHGQLAEDLAHTYNHKDTEKRLHAIMRGLRGLALAMGTHPRLGEQSTVMVLNSEVLRLVYGDHFTHDMMWELNARSSFDNSWEGVTMGVDEME